MGVKISGLKESKDALLRLKERAEQAIIQALCAAGKQLVETARSTKTYQDQSGNLSASMGFGVYSYGREIEVGGFGGGEGEQKGRELLMQVSPYYRDKQFVLIVVAGMDYAVAVERRGKVVLDGASLRAESTLATLMSSIIL